MNGSLELKDLLYYLRDALNYSPYNKLRQPEAVKLCTRVLEPHQWHVTQQTGWAVSIRAHSTLPPSPPWMLLCPPSDDSSDSGASMERDSSTRALTVEARLHSQRDGGSSPRAAASEMDDCVTPEQKEFWLRADHYLNGTVNSKANTKHGGLIKNLCDTLVSRRTDHTKEKDELVNEFIDHLGKSVNASVLQRPKADDNLGSLVTPGLWFYCKFDENHINHTRLPAHHKDQIVVGFHATSVARALEIAKVGVMEARAKWWLQRCCLFL